MEVYKFGGASIKDANGIKNLASILQSIDFSNTVVIISAINKTTNELEEVVEAYFNNKPLVNQKINIVKEKHLQILQNLYTHHHPEPLLAIKNLFKELETFIKLNKSPNHSFVYDQIVSYGELISTTIISDYLNSLNITNTWLDARLCVKTNNNYRQAQLQWEVTSRSISLLVNKNQLTITQGFIGSDENNFTTTLGREGSDYTAAIFAYCLNAKNLTIWKDVPGVLNADPRHFKNTKLINQLSYSQAIELAFYGASIIHPKTLQPLQQKEIPLHVKSFYHPEKQGTIINKTQGINPKLPCYIIKKNLILLQLSTLDVSFIVEQHISDLFTLFSKYKIKVHLIQNSAISFSVCCNDLYENLDLLKQSLKSKFKVICHEKTTLLTVKNFSEKDIKTIEKNKTILLKQITQETLQLVLA